MTLSSATETLTIRAVRAFLQTQVLGRQLSIVEETASTNRDAFVRAQAGAESGTVVVARSQTAGRGRRGRTWYSPPGENLYCSIIFAPPLLQRVTTPVLPWIPLLAGVAVVTAVRQLTGLQPCLKWPNDLLLNDKKCGGILCESGYRGKDQPFTIIGIGLNVNSDPDSFPDELKATSTSLHAGSHSVIDRAVLLAQILNRLEQHLALLATAAPDRWREEYVAHCSTVGRRVRVECANGERLEGLAGAIGEDGCLKIQTEQLRADDGSRRIIEVREGDVVHLRPVL